MDASYQELWGPVALARAQRNDLETPLENELGLLRAMRKRCGPFASVGLMVTHLRSARGKLHWSVNGYFRETVLDAGGSVDSRPDPRRERTPAGAPPTARRKMFEHGGKGHERRRRCLPWSGRLPSRVTRRTCVVSPASRAPRGTSRGQTRFGGRSSSPGGGARGVSGSRGEVCETPRARTAHLPRREGFDGSGGPGFAAGDDVDDDGVVPSAGTIQSLTGKTSTDRGTRGAKDDLPCHAPGTPIVRVPPPQLVTAPKAVPVR